MPKIETLPDDEEILSLSDWFEINNLSPATGFRILASADAPDVVVLSARRKGITKRANREWRARRTLCGRAA